MFLCLVVVNFAAICVALMDCLSESSAVPFHLLIREEGCCQRKFSAYCFQMCLKRKCLL